jgi:hypothetical protein
MSLTNYTFIKPHSGTYDLPGAKQSQYSLSSVWLNMLLSWFTRISVLVGSVRDNIRNHEYTDRIVTFITRQEPEITVMVILLSSLLVAFGLCYFYRLALSELFWQDRAASWRKLALQTNRDLIKSKFKFNKTIRELEATVRVLSIELAELKREQSKMDGIVISDNDREDLANNFVRIIETLPKGSNDTLRDIANLAKKFDIEITVTNDKQPRESLRKRPRRAAAPKKFHFSDDEDDDKKGDPDYKP